MQQAAKVNETVIYALEALQDASEQRRQFDSALAHERSLTAFWSKRVDEELKKLEVVVDCLTWINAYANVRFPDDKTICKKAAEALKQIEGE